MKDHIVEIVAIVAAVAILGFAWYSDSNKPKIETPTIQSQTAPE